jgi:hypothetical protein
MDDDLQGCDGINDTRTGMRPGVEMLLEVSACFSDKDTRCRKETPADGGDLISWPWWRAPVTERR